jgi:hypothetical protein
MVPSRTIVRVLVRRTLTNAPWRWTFAMFRHANEQQA